MSQDSDARIEELFNQALLLPAEQWDCFIRDAHLDELATKFLRSLLDHHLQVNSRFLSSSVAADPGAAQREVGRTIGSYKILRILGEGGMATVYEAEEDHPKRVVALKLIRPGWLTEALRKRLGQEVELLGRLEHPGIARIYHAGLIETLSGVEPYFAMELVRGMRLDCWVRDHNPPLKQRLELLYEIARAVQHAHENGVVHRDLKPSNILITAAGQPKILDFGIARAIDCGIDTSTLHTQVGQLVGTLPYMSPEQASGHGALVDPSSDVYSLGVIAYEVLCGNPPYQLSNKPLHEAVRVICEETPLPLGKHDRSLRGGATAIVSKALEKAKPNRYHTAGEMALDLRSLVDGQPIAAHPLQYRERLARTIRRKKTLSLLVATIAIIALPLAAIPSLRARFVATFRNPDTVYRANQERALVDLIRQRYDLVTKASVKLTNFPQPPATKGTPVTAVVTIEGFVNEDAPEQQNIAYGVRALVAGAVPGLTVASTSVILNGARYSFATNTRNPPSTFTGTLTQRVPDGVVRAVIGDYRAIGDQTPILSSPSSDGPPLSYTIALVAKGTILHAVSEGDDCVMIVPPPGTVCWISMSTVQPAPDLQSGTVMGVSTVRVGGATLKVKIALVARPGQRVTITGCDGDWYRIEPPPGTYCYVNK